MGLLVSAGVIAWPYTVDDAFIVARYASRWAAGLGYTMNHGPPTDGVTGPAWTALLALGAHVGLDPVDVAKGAGLGAAALVAGLVVAKLRGRALGRYPATWALLALAAQTTLSVWCVAGLETGVAALFATLVALETTGPKEPRGAVVGIAVAALAWLRPDLAPFAAVQLLATFAAARRQGAVALSIGLAGAISMIAFRLALFGHPLPLSFFAKGGDVGHGVVYVFGGVLLCTGGGGVLLASLGASRGGAGDRYLAIALLAHLAAVALTSGDWMPGYRLLAPVVPSYVLLAAQGVRLGQIEPRRGRLLLLAAALAVAVPAADLAVVLPIARRSGELRQASATVVTTALHRRHCGSVATVDVGYLAYRGGLTVVDLGGLTEPAVARLPGGHLDKVVGPGFLAARDPDCVLLHSSVAPLVDELGRLRHYDGFPVEERLVRDPWLWARYRVEDVIRYAPRYHYALLTRRPELSLNAAH
jgi:hypothetical protein